MTKLLKSLLLCLLAVSSISGMASAQVTGSSQLPTDARFDRKVTMNLPPLDLETYLKTLGSSVGLQVVPTNVPAVQVSLVFKDLPFRQVWNNIIAIYNLDFLLQPNDLVIVGTREAIAAIKPATPAPVAQPAPVVKTELHRYTIKSDPAAIRSLIETQFPGVKVSAVGNQLIVSATAEQHTAIQALLDQVDIAPAATPTPPPPPAEVKPVIRNYTIKGDVAAIRSLIETQFAGVKISTVGNKLVITATPDQQTAIQALLNDVDIAPPPAVPVVAAPMVPTVTETVSLSYVKASKLAEALQKVAQGTIQTSSNAAQASTLPGAAIVSLPSVTITAEDTSNTLIISGPQDVVQRLLKIIPVLDKPQQLVNVNVRIQEVTDEMGRNLGIDWSFGLGNFAGSIVGGTLNFVLDATRSLAGLNIGAALNALETQKLSKRVNDSTITVLNNGTGFLRSGGRIEINAVTTNAGGQGQVASRTIPYGVEVQVSPTIAADGSITLATAAKVSNVTNPNSTDFSRINFVDNEAASTVRMRDGQTLLLGSLLQTVESNDSSGLPLISSIPLIGDLFKKTEVTSNQTQLLIVITVNVIK